MIIEVFLKDEYSASENENLLRDLESAGCAFKKAVTSRLYRVEGKLTAKETKFAAEELLADKITERYLTSGFRKAPSCRIRAEIWLKPSVMDVVGESVKEAMEDMGLKKIKKVSCGKAVYAGPGPKSKAARNAFKAALCNPLVSVCKLQKI